MSITQRLAVSALICANESLIESGRLQQWEADHLRKIIGSVRDAFDDIAPRLPTLIICDPDFDATLECIDEVMRAAE